MSDEVLAAQLASIHGRLGVIEGKVSLIARAERRHLLELLEAVVRKDPLVGQIYLLLDGKRTQTEVLEKLAEFGVASSRSSISRYLTSMETEHGIIDLVVETNAKVYRRDPAMEKVLNLSTNVGKWLRAEEQVVPQLPARGRRKP